MVLRLLAMALFSVVLVGCSKSKDDKAQDVADVTNQRIDQLESLVQELYQNNVILLRYGSGCNVSSMSASYRDTARSKLSQVSGLSNEILASERTDGVTLYGRDNIEDAGESARACLQKI